MEHEGVKTTPHVLGPLAVRPPHIAASKFAGDGGPKNCLKIGNPLSAARNMSVETIGQGEDGSSHAVVVGITDSLLTRKEWKRHCHGRRRRWGANGISFFVLRALHGPLAAAPLQKRELGGNI